MKDQYFGDIGDYGKYGLLRFLCGSGLSVGANWYLTPNDGRTDGCHAEYLENASMRKYDPELFDFLKTTAERPGKSVLEIEHSSMLQGIRFFNELMDFDSIPDYKLRAIARNDWHERALNALSGCELIFADPDNGLSEKKRPTQKDAQKFILPNEIRDYFLRGKQVVYYHHRPRKDAEGWMKDKAMILNTLPKAKLLAVSFNRWSCRTYIFVLHEEQHERYAGLLAEFLNTNWGNLEVGGKKAFVEEELNY